MPLHVDNTLTPDDLTDATRSELLEYLGDLNATAKKIGPKHLGYALRHSQLDAVLDELDRRTCVRLWTA